MCCYGYSLIVSVAQTRLLTLSLPEWMMEFVRWFKLLCLWTKSYGATIQLKSLWKYFHVELFALKIFYNIENEFGVFVKFAFGHIWQ